MNQKNQENSRCNLLIEILCEEIPARMHNVGIVQAIKLTKEFFNANNVEYENIIGFISARRIIICGQAIADHSREIKEERRGPRVGAPQPAIAGFAKGCAMDIEQLSIMDSPKGQFYFADIVHAAIATKQLLPKLIQELLLKIQWPKSMRWAHGNHSWVRPIQSGICILNDEPVKFNISMRSGNINDAQAQMDGESDGYDLVCFSNMTKQHRNFSNDDVAIQNFAHYCEVMAKGYVIFDQNQRRAMIVEQIQQLLEPQGLVLVDNPRLLDEVVGLSEYPHILLGAIQPQFMHLPEAVLITCMAKHNKYFAVRDKKTAAMAPYFVAVAQYLSGGYDISQRGYEKVLQARFYDAKFFWDTDNKVTDLMKFGQNLHQVNFHAKLGSMAKKVEIITDMAQKIAQKITPSMDSDKVKQAAQLCKCDLTTQMVYEFPELQGIMGGHYSDNSGYDKTVSMAVAQHYQPLGPHDPIPESVLGRIIALADKVDTLVGFFSIGIKPSGSGDPFALRRYALGILRMLEATDGCTLVQLLTYAQQSRLGDDNDKLLQELLEFCQQRLQIYWTEQGFNHRAINSVMPLIGQCSLFDIKNRLRVIEKLLQEDRPLLQNHKRLANILNDKKNQELIAGLDITAIEVDKFEHTAQQNLYDCIIKQQPVYEQLLANKDYEQLLCEYEKQPLAQFFDNVMVNADDIDVRRNRVLLLASIDKLMQKFAYFGKI